MWVVHDKNGKFHHKTDSFAIAANLAGWIKGSYRWQTPQS